ncbi:MAG TPA: hypothetical protein PKD57_09030 [Saprospiraceae bacterium]|nr:hypothetical protein [Saprospiraceae bacterium]
MDKVHKVAIVVDKNFSKNQLLSVASKMHVWLIESDSNLKNTKAFYEQYNSSSDDLLADGITTFQNVEKGVSPASVLDSVIDEVDEHHNEYSHTPGWSELYVYGVPLNNKTKAILREFGFLNFQVVDLYNFIATK